MLKTLALSAAVVVATAVTAAAHTVGIGWLDNGNGTVTLYAEHWHGNLTSPYSDNGGLGIYDASGNFLYKTPWASVLNDVDYMSSLFGAGGDKALTGYIADSGNSGAGTYDDWLVSEALVLGNGTWGFFTGTGCCVDTMTAPIYGTVTGIDSVPDGTGPAAVVPLPASLPLFGTAIACLGLYRRLRG